LSPLVSLGFPFLEDTARALCRSRSLREMLDARPLDPRLREILTLFLEDS
jgi:hypothetical protein